MRFVECGFLQSHRSSDTSMTRNHNAALIYPSLSFPDCCGSNDSRQIYPLHFSSTLVAKPRTSWFLCHGHAAPVKPFIWTIIVVTCNHITIANAATGAIFPVIAFPLNIIHLDIRLAFLPIALAEGTLLPCVGRTWFQMPERATQSGFLARATPVGFFIGSTRRRRI
jgi:hypothetical protein